MKRSLNLMSARTRKGVQRHRCLRLWSRIFIGVFLLLSARSIVRWRSFNEQEQRLVALELEYEPIRKLKLESRKLRHEIEKFQEAERVPLALTQQKPLLGLLGLTSQAMLASEDKIFLQHLEIYRNPLGQQTANRPALTFELTGKTIDPVAATLLEDSFRKFGPFDTVKLSTSQASQFGKITQQPFTIECTN